MRVTENVVDVINAFCNLQPLRTQKLRIQAGWNGWNYHTCERVGARDDVQVENGVATYYLWGSPIATFDGEILTMHDCGYPSRLTKGRMNWILNSFFPSPLGRTSYMPYIDFKPLTKLGFSFLYFPKVIHPLPLKINIRTRQIISEFDKGIYLQKLARAQSEWTIKHYINLCKTLKILIPQDIQDKITARRFKQFLKAA